MTIPLDALPAPKYKEKLEIRFKAKKPATSDKDKEFLDLLLDKPFLNQYFKKMKKKK